MSKIVTIKNQDNLIRSPPTVMTTANDTTEMKTSINATSTETLPVVDTDLTAPKDSETADGATSKVATLTEGDTSGSSPPTTNETPVKDETPKSSLWTNIKAFIFKHWFLEVSFQA
jgi:hypothetical protein